MNKFDMSLSVEKDAPRISWKLSNASLDMLAFSAIRCFMNYTAMYVCVCTIFLKL